MSGDKFADEFYDSSAYTADISTKMRIPEHINAHGSLSNGEGGLNGKGNSALYDMQVPDRIMIAGSDDHFYPKSTPRELQLEKSVMPPTPELVRVQTPPRSIKLGEVSYDSAPTTPQHRDNFVRNVANGGVGGLGTPRNRIERGGSVDGDSSLRAESVEGLTVYDEVQMMRRQIAKLNHRLMAVELENQQQQQREMTANFPLAPSVSLVSSMSCGYDEVSAAVTAKQPPIVDVRTEDEFASGRIPGATNIPLSEVEYAFSLPEEKFQAKYGISKPSKNTTFITSCKVGGRATKMRDKLNEMGYNMVKAYTGSLTEWIKMGGEVEK